MALAGISKPRLEQFGIGTTCLVADPLVARTAAKLGVTRSILAMRTAAAKEENGIFVVGNAPTALFELLRLVREEGMRPDLVVGLPVGFVGAAESKEELLAVAEEFNIPFITNRGRKGGSNVAAAVVNALLILAGEGL
jgi:precorrin-8X/cobalt-precorrin-8 methylmutase